MSPPSGSLNFIASPAEANLTTISSVATFFPLLGVAKVPGSRCLGVGGQGGKGNASGGSRGSARRGSWINCHLSPQILTMDMCSLIQLHLLHVSHLLLLILLMMHDVNLILLLQLCDHLHSPNNEVQNCSAELVALLSYFWCVFKPFGSHWSQIHVAQPFSLWFTIIPAVHPLFLRFTPYSCGSPLIPAVHPLFLRFTLYSCGSPLILAVHPSILRFTPHFCGSPLVLAASSTVSAQHVSQH